MTSRVHRPTSASDQPPRPNAAHTLAWLLWASEDVRAGPSHDVTTRPRLDCDGGHARNDVGLGHDRLEPPRAATA
jgi:hypothetical protein